MSIDTFLERIACALIKSDAYNQQKPLYQLRGSHTWRSTNSSFQSEFIIYILRNLRCIFFNPNLLMNVSLGRILCVHLKLLRQSQKLAMEATAINVYLIRADHHSGIG